MVDLTSLQHDVLYVPLLLVLTLLLRFIFTRLGIVLEERLVAQILTFVIIFLSKILSNNVKNNPHARTHAMNIRQELELLKTRLKPPKVTLG